MLFDPGIALERLPVLVQPSSKLVRSRIPLTLEMFSVAPIQLEELARDVFAIRVRHLEAADAGVELGVRIECLEERDRD